MADVQEGIQVLFDQIESSEASSDSATDTTAEENRDYHQEQYPSYVPPHKRGHNLGQDKFVNIKAGKNGLKDKEEGIDNEKYQKIVIQVPFALDRNKLARLKVDFPGVFFHCRDNGNHDHAYSHMVTVIGTRLMQRRIKPGMRALDVYGNPNACDKFNMSQANAAEPKFMKALVNRTGPADFIREVNKWGPLIDVDTQTERYHRGSLDSLVKSGEIADYDVLHLTHTLYYITMQQMADALHAPGRRRVAYALIHKHVAEKGAINDGEQTYMKKWVNGEKLVRQVNVSTKSAYVHPDLTDVFFTDTKVWLPSGRNMTVHQGEEQHRKGLTWELHVINDDTWVVEIVPYIDQEVEGVKDYAAMWDDDEMLSLDDPMTTPSVSSDNSVHQTDHGVLIPTPDGKFVELDVPCVELYRLLRMRCAGKERTPKLLEELISTANHLVNPSALFGSVPGVRCPPDKIFDVAVAAFTVDVPKEVLIHKGITCLRPVLAEHARGLKLGPKFRELGLSDMLSALRTSLQAIKFVNRLVKSADPLDLGISAIEGYL